MFTLSELICIKGYISFYLLNSFITIDESREVYLFYEKVENLIENFNG